ncbi:MAG: fused MFS/spermidine synthase [bacterium]
MTHLTLLGIAVAWAFLVAALRLPLKGLFGDFSAPSLEVIFCVLVFVGLPYVLLAAGSTWVQAWVAAGAGVPERGEARRGVYRLYAVSNLGSLLGLLAYPFVLEPFVPLTAQWYGFAVGLAGYTALVWMTGKPHSVIDNSVARERPNFRASFQWFLLPAVSACLLNAVIAHLFTDVTPMPLIWVGMLAAFLLSYVVGFSRFGENRRGAWCGLSALALVGAAVTNGLWGAGSFYPNVAAAVALIFCVGVLLHGWLYAERPDTLHLTRFYLMIAAGGAAGGLLASIAAPWVFNRVLEYPLILLVCALLVAWRVPKPAFVVRSRRGVWVYMACCGTAWLALASVTARHSQARVMFRARNFYGSLAVTQTMEAFGTQGMFPVYYLWCGQTTHGIQVRAPFYKGRGTAYYGQTGGGIALFAHPNYPAGRSMKVGVVGLGAGTLACYGRSCDLYRFYEINPQVIQVATDPRLFTYLPDAQTPIDLVPGDARRMLEKERAAGDPLYDVLVIDAYSGDAVPYHLATLEAFRLYFERLAPGGILAVHVSNWHIDLLPLCKAVALELGVCPYGVVGVEEDSVTSSAIWVFMTRQPMDYRYPGKSQVREVVWSQIRNVNTPTDEKGSLISLLRF